MAIPETDSRELRVESNNQYTAVTATSGESLGQTPRINYQYSSGENKNSSSYDIGVNRESLAHHLTKETYTNAAPQQSVYAKHEERTATEAELNKTPETDSNEATGQEIFENVQEYVRRAYGEDGLRKIGLLSPEEGGEEAKAEVDAEPDDHSEEEQATVAYEATETKTEKDPFTQRVGRVAGRLSVKATKVTSAFSTAPFRELDKTTTEAPDEMSEVRLTMSERARNSRVVQGIGTLTAAAVLLGSVEVQPSEETATEVSAAQQRASSVNMEAAEFLSQMQEDATLSAEADEAAAEAEETVETGAEGETEQVNHSNEQHETAEEAPKPEITIEWIPETVKRHERTIVEAAEKHGISPDVIAIIMTLESGGNANARSSADAEGLMQLWPPTRDNIMRQRGMSEANMFDPELNVDFGAGMLKGLLEKYLGTSDVTDANAMRVIAAGYNGGPGRAVEVIKHNFDLEAANIPKETKKYARHAGEMFEERGDATGKTFEHWKKPVSEGGHNGYVLVEQAKDYWSTMPETPGQAVEVKAASAAEPEPTQETAEREPQYKFPINPEDAEHISSCYGMREHPIYGGKRLHAGLDIGAPEGTPILAADEGVVVESKLGHPTKGYGKRVTIQHPDGSRTMYTHNSVNIAGVGQEVDKGVPIAEVGSTGGSTGPHLHLELKKQKRNKKGKGTGSYYPVDITDDSFRIPDSVPNPKNC